MPQVWIFRPGFRRPLQLPSSGYAPNGNILAHSDSVMGDWAYSYDALDRLMSATPAANAPSQYAGQQACWACDAFGNRTLEAISSAACQANPTPQALVAYNPVNNQISSSTLSSATLTAGSYQYDAAGNTLYDGNNRYWYDAEGQLCAVQSLRTTGAAVVQYVYDAEGARIAKGTLAAAPAASTSSCSPPLGAGFTLTARYLVGLGGDQVTELNGAGVWQHSNVWAGGKLVGTYDMKELHFDLADPLGTKRVQANASGQVDEYCMSLPFGNDVNNPVAANCVAPNPAPATADDATEHHFTQKERDAETGNDYFGARYYASSMGRFISPDWSAAPDSVPYADFSDPQSLDLYGYVRNNPLSRTDPNGHWCIFGFGTTCTPMPKPPPPPAPTPPAVVTPGTPQNNLANAQDAARANPAYQPVGTPGSKDRKTFCNIATCEIVKATGTTTDGLLNSKGKPNIANDDAKLLANSNAWHPVTPEEAQKLANEGILVVGVISEPGHGHIVTVRPEMIPGDQDVAKNGPLVNNIGAHVGVTNGIKAFGGAKPTYYAPTNQK